jgi:hypothetical protein
MFGDGAALGNKEGDFGGIGRLAADMLMRTTNITRKRFLRSFEKPQVLWCHTEFAVPVAGG